jgi:urease accessory protein
LGDTVESFLGAANDSFTHLATINWFALILALGCFGMYLLLRSRAAWLPRVAGAAVALFGVALLIN